VWLLKKTTFLIIRVTRVTRRNIPEDVTLHSHRCGNLKSYIVGVVFMKTAYFGSVFLKPESILRHNWTLGLSVHEFETILRIEIKLKLSQ
jgi:hypothetical protein